MKLSVYTVPHENALAANTESRRAVYLDYNATTPLDPRVFNTMRPYFTEFFGNPASTGHSFGRAAKEAVDRARADVLELLGAGSGAGEIIWASGATESNNLAIKGVAAAYREKGRHIITQPTEHKAVLDVCRHLGEDGFEVTELATDRRGLVFPEQVAEAIRPDTILVSIMYANNETGTIQPIRGIGAVCQARGVLFHTDATQAVGKVTIDVLRDGVDLLSLSAHKLYGPKGVGALFVRRTSPPLRLEPLFNGGGQERGLRPGTLNVPAIVGLAAACKLVAKELHHESHRLAHLRDRLESQVLASLERVFVHGDRFARLPNVTNLGFAGAAGRLILAALDDIAVSSGSACSSAVVQVSHVLRAMGVDDELSSNSIRFSLGRFTTEAEVDYAAEKVVGVVKRLRGHGTF